MPTIGSKIKKLRLALGMSADDLAARIGKNRATLYRYEADQVEIPLSVIEALAEALHVTPASLTDWETDPVPADEPQKIPESVSQIYEELSLLPEERRQEVLRYIRFLSKSSGT